MNDKLRVYVYGDSKLGIEGKGQLAQYAHQTATGISQMVFNENAILGLAIAAVVAVMNPSQAVAIVGGSALATFWANVLNLDEGFIKAGLFGFNSILLCCALNVFVNPVSAVVGMSVVGSLGTVVLFHKARNLSFPVISLPFVLATNTLLLASRPFSSITSVPFSAPNLALSLPTDLAAVLHSIPVTFSNLFFMNEFWTGLFILGACASLGDRRVAISGIAGAAIGSLVGAFFGLGYTCAFMSALTSMGLYPYFGATVSAALTGAALTGVVQVALMTAFGFFGLPALSAPFCLTTIGILLFLKRK